MSPQTDKQIRRAARSARRTDREVRGAAEAVQAASERTGGRTEGTYGVDRVSSAKMVLWMRQNSRDGTEGRAVALLSQYLDERCQVGFRCHLESEELLERTEFWIEIIWLDKIIGHWAPEVNVLRGDGEKAIVALLTWEAKDE